MKKVFSVFRRDLQIVLKDPMALWIGFAPILLAIIIVLVSPGINDSTLQLAVHTSVGSDYIGTLENYAKVEVYDDIKAVEERVLRRDEVIGMVQAESGIELISQGNESENGLKTAELINSLYELDGLVTAGGGSRLSFLTFNEKISPLKLSLSVALLLMTTIISAMVIALGLVDEKADKTIRAANVTPMKQTSYILSKSIIGFLVLIFSSVISLLVLGMAQINWLQMMIMILSAGLLSIIVAFAIGLASSDFIEAAGSIKILMVPMLASVLVYELCSAKWHWTVMWSPFYWAYKGMTEIINHTSSWSGIALYAVIILAICALAFKLCAKNIRKSLN
ncbi:ABC transporter permease [Sedimentibacter sp. zth1]|uniref:ABC transporter permease n=1 Tax=Sedimentibacter sp. zth1 TaxID=2816908 RepID=UPI001A932B55|nr:ABC transporter permease [Sedimentibacter sp. zth1]QSX04867.1 ABC transporter permease [Sedimentibacter sp. zth1]